MILVMKLIFACSILGQNDLFRGCVSHWCGLLISEGATFYSWYHLPSTQLSVRCLVHVSV